MGPLFSLGLLALFASTAFGLVFVIARAHGLSAKGSFVAAIAFVIGAVGGAIAAAVVAGIVIGFGGEISSSAGVATYLGTL